MGDCAWVTLATNDSYSLGALVLAHSLKQVNTKHQLAVIITSGVTQSMREKLCGIFDLVREVNVLDSRDRDNLTLLKRPDLGMTFTKLHCWRLIQFSKCVFLDADTLVLKNCDELFEREELSAARDVGWPDCFNSGVFVYRPSQATFARLLEFSRTEGSFDGGDQGLLNMFFHEWSQGDIKKHLPFIYNMCSTACYSYAPAFKHFGRNTKIVHFIGTNKPWTQYFNPQTRRVHPSSDYVHLTDILQYWWDLFCEFVHPALSEEMPASQSQNNTNETNVHIHNPFPNPESSADDYENAWDPWNEYIEKTTQNVQPLEPLNTNASIANKSPIIYSQPHSNIAYSSHIAQSFSHSVPINQPTSCDNIHQTSINHSIQQENSYHDKIQHHPLNHQHYRSHWKDDIISYPKEPVPIFNKDCHETPPDELETHNHKHYHLLNQHYEPDDLVSIHDDDPSNFPKYSVPILSAEHEPATTNDTFLSSPIEEIQRHDAGMAGAFAQLTLGEQRTAEQEAFESLMRKQSWEIGNIDYLGRDSFDNIWSKIAETLSAGEEPSTSTSTVETASSVSVSDDSTSFTTIEQPSSTGTQSQSQSQPTAPSQEETKSTSSSSDIPEPIQTSLPEKVEPLLSIQDTKQEEQTPKDGALLPSQTEACPLETQAAQPAVLPTPCLSEQKVEQKPEETCPLIKPIESTESITKASPENPPTEPSPTTEQLPASVVSSDVPKLKEEPKESPSETVLPLGTPLAETSSVVLPESSTETTTKSETVQESVVKPEEPQKGIQKTEVLDTESEKPATATESEATKSTDLETVATAPIALKSPTETKTPPPTDIPPSPTVEKTPPAPTKEQTPTSIEDKVVPASSETKAIAVVSEVKPPSVTQQKIDEKSQQTVKESVAPTAAISTQKPSSAPSKEPTKTKDTETVGTSSEPSTKQSTVSAASVSDKTKQGASTPTPPPRKTDKSKKAATKPKK